MHFLYNEQDYENWIKIIKKDSLAEIKVIQSELNEGISNKCKNLYEQGYLHNVKYDCIFNNKYVQVYEKKDLEKLEQILELEREILNLYTENIKYSQMLQREFELRDELEIEVEQLKKISRNKQSSYKNEKKRKSVGQLMTEVIPYMHDYGFVNTLKHILKIIFYK